MESFCEHGNETSSLMEDGEILDSVNFLCYLQWGGGGSLVGKREEAPHRPGVAQRVPGGLGSPIFMTFGT